MSNRKQSRGGGNDWSNAVKNGRGGGGNNGQNNQNMSSNTTGTGRGASSNNDRNNNIRAPFRGGYGGGRGQNYKKEYRPRLLQPQQQPGATGFSGSGGATYQSLGPQPGDSYAHLNRDDSSQASSRQSQYLGRYGAQHETTEPIAFNRSNSGQMRRDSGQFVQSTNMTRSPTDLDPGPSSQHPNPGSTQQVAALEHQVKLLVEQNRQINQMMQQAMILNQMQQQGNPMAFNPLNPMMGPFPNLQNNPMMPQNQQGQSAFMQQFRGMNPAFYGQNFQQMAPGAQAMPPNVQNPQSSYQQFPHAMNQQLASHLNQPNKPGPSSMPLNPSNQSFENVRPPDTTTQSFEGNQVGGQRPPNVNNSNQVPRPVSSNNVVDTQLALEDMREQERTSLYKLRNLKEEIRTEIYSLAWDKPLLILLTKGSGNARQWCFSFRCRKNVFLSRISLDQMERTEFSITKITVHDTESNEDYPRSLPDEVHLNNKEWESQGQRLKCFVVEISYTPPANQEQKVEVCLQFELSNGTVVEKYVQVLKKPPNFKHESYERESIETYKPLKLGVKKRNVVSVDNRMDDWTKNLEGKYQLRPLGDDSIPNVHQTTKDSYKKDLHAALYMEEMARYSALSDLSLQANVDFLPEYKNGDNKTVKCDNKSVYAVFKCPFQMTEDSIKGEALNDVADYVILSRRGDWDKTQSFVSCIGGKICDRFFRTEAESYSTYDLKKDVRNFYIVVHLNREETFSQKYEFNRSEFMYVEFLLNRKEFIHCHYAVDQIVDESAFFPGQVELSSRESPPWYIQPYIEDMDKDYQEELLREGKIFYNKGTGRLQRSDREQKAITQYQNSVRDRYFLDDLNLRQQDACEACWYKIPKNAKSYPPILITGPFGTGKTHTIAYATQKIVQDPKAGSPKILICIVSRNTGNAYHRQLLKAGLGDKCIRLFSEDDDLSAVDDDLIQFSNCSGDDPKFRLPCKADIEPKSVVIVTLSAAILLHQIGFKPNNFTHVFIDEAAQVAEFFLVPVLSFVSRKNKLCITGDVMQLNPLLFNQPLSACFAHSIVQRLDKLVYKDKPCGFRYKLDVNYRSNVKILDFAYPQFYQMPYNDQSKEKAEAAFPTIYPLQFWNVRGKMSAHQSVASNCNWIEANEIVKVVKFVLNEATGTTNLEENGIGVATSYLGQVKAIKEALWENEVDMSLIDVDTVRNIQGRQYRVLIVSIVTDCKTVMDTITDTSKRDNDLGFLSDLKLVCTAITRAISAVFVVGDATALLISKDFDKDCYETWAKYVELTIRQSSLVNEEYPKLRARIDQMRRLIAEKLDQPHSTLTTEQSVVEQQQELAHQLGSISFN
ncbi:uncharacterized protein LOC142339503 isoform X2 [Convolutriloba macropyga]|uniref:uncharacterized protein LOC142339503 isoform X2 n=1 Tax=Convolutriloba macropyga TaxID=536237 RepID=UPI003F52894D